MDYTLGRWRRMRGAYFKCAVVVFWRAQYTEYTQTYGAILSKGVELSEFPDGGRLFTVYVHKRYVEVLIKEWKFSLTT